MTLFLFKISSAATLDIDITILRLYKRPGVW